MGDGSDFEKLDDDVLAFEQSVGGARVVLTAFDTEMRSMRSTVSETGREVATLSRGISRGLKKSFEGLTFDGKKLSDVLQGLAQSMVDSAYRAAINPAAKHFGGTLTSGVEGVLSRLLPFEHGAPFSQGRVTPFASGGVVSGPISFPMRGGTGLMGEAGPEAIMPLQRGADGKLGVRAAAGAGRAINVTMNISTPDADSFRRSQSQIAAQVSRALARGQRNR